MSDFITRLREEKVELDKKTISLSDFLQSDHIKVVSDRQRELLKEQLVAMRQYSNILEDRLTDLDNE